MVTDLQLPPSSLTGGRRRSSSTTVVSSNGGVFLIYILILLSTAVLTYLVFVHFIIFLISCPMLSISDALMLVFSSEIYFFVLYPH